MHIDSAIYNDFHLYIDRISNNKNTFNTDNFKNVDYLKSLYSSYEPSITIHDYIDRIIKYIYKNDSNIDGLIVNAIVLLKRIMKFIIINNYNIHRLLAGVLMISQKVYDDIPHNNYTWAKLCGVKIKDINKIELDILQTIDYNIFIKYEEMITVIKSIKYL